MQISQFYAQLRSAIRRGNSVDSDIPGWAAECANLIETDNTFSWMRSTVFGQTVNPLNTPYGVLFSVTPLLKSVDWIKFPISSGSAQLYDLKGYSSQDLVAVGVGPMPSGYYITETAVFADSLPTTVVQGVASCASYYTDWVNLDPTAAPAILNRGLAYLKAETLLLAAQDLRDPRLTDTYGARRDRARDALLRADAEMMWHSQDDLWMEPE